MIDNDTRVTGTWYPSPEGSDPGIREHGSANVNTHLIICAVGYLAISLVLMFIGFHSMIAASMSESGSGGGTGPEHTFPVGGYVMLVGVALCGFAGLACMMGCGSRIRAASPIETPLMGSWTDEIGAGRHRRDVPDLPPVIVIHPMGDIVMGHHVAAPETDQRFTPR